MVNYDAINVEEMSSQELFDQLLSEFKNTIRLSEERPEEVQI